MGKVLFVDDNPEVLKGYLVEASSREVDSVGALNGSNALKVLAKESIDVVVSDMCMPIMNGIELLLEMRRIPEYRQIPFIMVSGSISNSLRGELDNFEVSGFTKPVSYPLLFEKIDSLRHRECL